MRIVIDMQGAQTESRFRGIGRYTLNLTKAIAENASGHEIILVLNGMFPDTIQPIRRTFSPIIGNDAIRVWVAEPPVSHCHKENTNRIQAAEILRESFIESLSPDVVLITSFFEGLADDAVTSIGSIGHTPTAVILYDLIPLIAPDNHFKTSKIHQSYYHSKICQFKKADLLLAISESAKAEAVEGLGYDADKILNIAGACDSCFRVLDNNALKETNVLSKLGICGPFMMYSGGADERKNLHRLIQAFSMLPEKILSNCQLVLAGKMPTESILALKKVVSEVGLSESDVVFTGYITDEDLVRLYNLCQAFVFPSLHEGLGLPPLEAMSCGAPVIAANATSLPEVVGLDEALFDPLSVTDITEKMIKVISDDDFRSRLISHGKCQAKFFTWDGSARAAIKSLESLYESALNELPPVASLPTVLDRLASDLRGSNDIDVRALSRAVVQNQRNSFARQLLLDVSEFYRQDAGTGVQRVVKKHLENLLKNPPKGFVVEPVYASSDDTGYRYAWDLKARVFGREVSSRHVGNDLMDWQRGDIFFGLDMQHHVQLRNSSFYQTLRSEGVFVGFLIHDLLPISLSDLFKDPGLKELHEQWLVMISETDFAICVSYATSRAYESWLQNSGIRPAERHDVACVHNGADIVDASVASQATLPNQLVDAMKNRLSFLCVSTLEPRKRQEQVLDALDRLWLEEFDVNLIFAGSQGWHMEALVNRIEAHYEFGKRLFWFPNLSDSSLSKLYQSSQCFLAASLDEGFGLPVVEAAMNRLPVIARDIPVFREIAGESAFYFSGEESEALPTALKHWLKLYANEAHPKPEGIKCLSWSESSQLLSDTLISRVYAPNQLFVDISELIRADARTGIQRVVRSVLNELLDNPPGRFCVQPVCATVDGPYCYADKSSAEVRNDSQYQRGTPIEFRPGDIFLGLDLAPEIVPSKRLFYQHLRNNGVSVKFVVYDLLTEIMPQFFGERVVNALKLWLKVVAESDGAICISQAVANEFSEWCTSNELSLPSDYEIDWFHLGADIDASVPSKGIKYDAEDVIGSLAGRPTFLMVGTIEPRKGHEQVVKAFDDLWKHGEDINLVLVGKEGWLTEQLCAYLGNHQEKGQRLFWLNGISDELLAQVYENSDCLIAASHGEGFGLPLIEAARQGIPIIARRIPVFQEVAGEHAFYFEGESGDVLPESIRSWLTLFHKEQHPRSKQMPWMTWKESVAQLKSRLLPEQDESQSSDIRIH